MSRGRWKILIGIAALIGLGIGVELTTLGDGPKKAVEAYRKFLIAKGEKLDVSELTPPPVPPEQNGADVVNEAFGLLTPEDDAEPNLVPSMRMIAPGKAIVCFKQPYIRGWNFTNSWSNEMAVVEDDRPTTELLRQAMAYPAIDFHLDYSGDRETLLRQTMICANSLRRCAQRLSAAALCDLHRGDAGSAATNICAMLALVNGLRDERLDVFTATRSFITLISSTTTWEFLQSENLQDSELALLQTNWMRLQFIGPMENEIAMERALEEAEIRRMENSDEFFNRTVSWAKPGVDWSDGFRGGLSDIWDDAKLLGAKSMLHAMWIYSDELRMLKDQRLVLDILRAAATNGFFYPAYGNLIIQLKAQSEHPQDW
ncbi:MAG: hypothetical protein ACREFR_08955, partial [Limisphaerales bacterium]